MSRKIVFALLLLSATGTWVIRASEPQPVRCDTVAIFSINDFHGGFVCSERQGVPGAENLLAALNKLCATYPAHIVVSTGDNFGGSYFSKLTDGALMPQLFKLAGITLSAVGNHEFDYGQQYLADKWSQTKPADWSIDYLAANITDKTGKLPSWCISLATREVSLPVSQKKVKLVLVGMSPKSTPLQTAAGMTDGLTFSGDYVGVLNGLENHPSTKEVLKQANARVLLTHIGTKTENNRPAWSDPVDGANLANLPSEYCGMLSGHSHKYVCGKIGELSVVQGEISGKYICGLLLVFDPETRAVKEVIPKVFPVEYQNPPLKTEIGKKIDEVFEKNELNKVVAKAADNLPHSRNDNKRFTSLGSYVCEAYARAVDDFHTDLSFEMVLGLSHFGGIRAPVFAGDVSKYDACEVLPFAPELNIYLVSGRRLKTILEEGINNNAYGYMQTFPVECTYYIGEDGSKRIDRIVTKDEKHSIELDGNTMYLVVVDSYVTTGGDGYSPFLFSPKFKVAFADFYNAQQAWLRYLGTMKQSGTSLSSAKSSTLVLDDVSCSQRFDSETYCRSVLNDFEELYYLAGDYIDMLNSKQAAVLKTSKSDMLLLGRLKRHFAWFDRFRKDYVTLTAQPAESQAMVDAAVLLEINRDFESSTKLDADKVRAYLLTVGEMLAKAEKSENLEAMLPAGIFGYACQMALYGRLAMVSGQFFQGMISFNETYSRFKNYLTACKEALAKGYVARKCPEIKIEETIVEIPGIMYTRKIPVYYFMDYDKKPGGGFYESVNGVSPYDQCVKKRDEYRAEQLKIREAERTTSKQYKMLVDFIEGLPDRSVVF